MIRGVRSMKMKMRFGYLMTGLLVILAGCAAGGNGPETAETSGVKATQSTSGIDVSSSDTSSVASASSSPDMSSVPPSGFLTIDEKDYPRVDGSTATIPLGEAAAAVLMGKPREECAKYAAFTGTDQAYRRLLAHEVDMLIVYEAAAGTKNEFRVNGNAMEDVFNIVPIGSDGLVFLVNADNPVDSLTVEQLRKIYAGEITNWSEVGGEDAPIAAFQRNKSAGSQALIEKLVMDGTPMANPREDYIANTMEGLVTAVSDFDTGRYALGYNVFYYVTEMKKDPNVKILAVDGVLPGQDTIQRGTYALFHDFYVVTRKDEPPESAASLLSGWLQGDEGQMLIDREGYAAKAD